MRRFRQLVREYRLIALLFAALAIMAKAFVPAGYMIDRSARVLTVSICADASGPAQTRQIVIAGDDTQSQHAPNAAAHDGQPGAGCAWSMLAMGGVSGGDPALLALLLAFILLIGFAPARTFQPRRIAQLRPPLRGPPSPA